MGVLCSLYFATLLPDENQRWTEASCPWLTVFSRGSGPIKLTQTAAR
jgi:hypothetical protein